MDIANEIQSLFNPNPTDEQEDYDDERTLAKVVDRGSDDEGPIDFPSQIRRANAPLLDELDSRYSGAVVKRTSLQRQTFDDSSEGNSVQSDAEEEEDSDRSDAEKEGTDAEDEEESDVEEETTEEADESFEHFSRVNADEEVEKGKAVQSQLKLWDSLLAARIKLQRLLVLSNRLPQGRTWEEIQKSSAEPETVKKLTHDCQRKLERLVNKLVSAQNKLFASNSCTRLLAGFESATISKKDDDEITSEEDEVAEPKGEEMTAAKKRAKYNQRNGQMLLAKRHKSFEKFQNDTLLKWHEKTKLASGKFGKNFQAFDQNVLTQISEILSDRNRLIKRSQLKRSDYEILGKPKVPIQISQPEPNGETVATEVQTDGADSATASRVYDEEIFDDDDFYQHLLRELIERKATEVTDPVALGRHWIEIQKFRKQIKRKVDTKASKGRKIRYDVQPKLVNLMAPVDNCKWTDSSRRELFGSLFGRLPHSSDPV